MQDSLDLVKARIAVAHTAEIKHQMRLMLANGFATDLDYSNAVLNWVEAIGELHWLELIHEIGEHDE